MMDLIPDLNKLGVKNYVFGIGNSPLHKECENNEVSFISAKKSKLNKFQNYIYLKTIVREIKPNVIHLHTSDSLTVYTISDILFRLKTKAIFSKKGIGNSSSLLSKFKYNYKNINKIICVSNAVKKSFSEIVNAKNHDKLIVVYDGINLDRTNIKRDEDIRTLFNVSENKLIIGNIANHVKAKDLPTLIKAVNYLVNEENIKNVHLIQIGEFSIKITTEIEKLITEYNLQNFVTLAGFQYHALDFLSQFDLFVMSSEREGLPLTIYEAFLKKTPVVSTKAGGIPEAITHGINGYLSEVGDPKELGENIQMLLGDTKKREEFIKRSYDIFFDKFTSKINAKNTLEVYQNIK